MLKKTLTYEDFDGNKTTETFHFNLTMAELTKLVQTDGESIQDKIRRATQAEDAGTAIEVFQDILCMAIGQRSEDGKLFRKSPQITEEFMASAAYSALFMEFVADAAAGATFVRAIMPKELAVKIDEKMKEAGDDYLKYAVAEYTDASLPKFVTPDELAENIDDGPRDAFLPRKMELDPSKKLEEYTEAELIEMPQSHFDFLVGTDVKKWPKKVLQIAFQRKTS